jgi:hypothetical protein
VPNVSEEALMRLPFLQVPQLDMSRGRTLARILRIPEAHGIGLTVALDAWAVEEAPEGDVSGLVRDPAPAEAMALAVGWAGDPDEFLAALVRVKLVEVTPDGPRVVSVQRYEQALTGSVRRSEAGSVAAYARWHGKKDANRIGIASANACDPMRSDAYTQTHMETQKDLPPPASAGSDGFNLAVQEAPKRTKAKKPQPEKPPDPRHAPLIQQLVAACQEVTTRPYRFNGGIDAAAVRELLKSADQDVATRGEAAPAEVVRRWKIGLRWRWKDGEAPVQDLPSLQRWWQRCATTETAPPARVSSGPTMSDFTSVLGKDLYGTGNG